MTAPSPRSKLRWRWPVLLIAFGILGVAIQAGSSSVSARIHVWLREASHGTPLVVKYDWVPVIPGVEQDHVSRRVVGRREITVVVFDEDDAEKLLSMPPCPVKLVVETVARTPPDVVTKLRGRFGDAVQ